MSPNRIIVARFSPTGRTRRLMSMIAQGLAGTALPVEELDLTDRWEREEARTFGHITTHANHLSDRADMLREYSLQLYELHQTQIDLKQNSTMQILTIVTVMFAPLTLVTGWFGMNLTVLPGLDWPYMAATIITLALVMIVVMVLFFKRKRWL